MTSITIYLTANTEEKIIWSEMKPETQVIYAFLREAVENAGYELERMDIEMRDTSGSSTVTCTCKVEL